MANKIQLGIAGIMGFLLINCISAVAAAELMNGTVHHEAMQTIFSGQEEMHFSISWTGGVKIGDLNLSLIRIAEDEFEMYVRVTDYGLFKFFYPVDDLFVTLVSGPDKLP